MIWKMYKIFIKIKLLETNPPFFYFIFKSLLGDELFKVILHSIELTDEHFSRISLIIQVLLVKKCLFEHFSHIFLLNQSS